MTTNKLIRQNKNLQIDRQVEDIYRNLSFIHQDLKNFNYDYVHGVIRVVNGLVGINTHTPSHQFDCNGKAVIRNTLTVKKIEHETTDVDKFLVDSSSIIKYRTGAEVLSDIGATSLIGLGTDNTITRWDGTDTVQDSGITIDDSNDMVSPASITADSFITGSDIGIAADTDIIQLTAADTMIINAIVGIGESSPGTQIDMASTAPYITIHNTTEEDGDGGREGKLIFEGEQSGGELNTLGELEFSHDGTGDDSRGQYTIRIHNGSALQDRFYIDRNGYTGINTTSPASMLEVYDATNNIALTITGAGAQRWETIYFRTGPTPTIVGAIQYSPLDFYMAFSLYGKGTIYVYETRMDFCLSNNYPVFAINQINAYSYDTGIEIGHNTSLIYSWKAGLSVIETSSSAISFTTAASASASIDITTNAYLDKTDDRWEYRQDGLTTRYEQSIITGDHIFYAAASGFANNAISWTEILILNITDAIFGDGIGVNLYEDLTFLGATTENIVAFPDDLADALSFKEGANSYLTFVTTNGSEQVTFGKIFSGVTGSTIGTLTLADGSITDSGGNIDFGNENLTTSGNIVLDTGYVDSKAYYYINGTKVISVDGTGNVIFGSSITCTGNYCALIGLSASANVSGDYNCIVAYGNYAGLSGSRNVFLGGFAGRITTTGSYNLFIGYRAGYNNVGGNYNSGFGYYALYNTTTNSQNNLGFGAQAGYSNTTGDFNLYIGENTGLFQQTGSENVFLGGGAGYGAGAAAYSADQHVAIGRYALYNATNGTSRNVCIGYQAGYYETGSYKLFIDNDDRANEADGRVKALIYGIFNAATASQLLLVNGYLWNREGLCGYERSSDPTEPAEGEYVIWMSDGTGKGDDGDIMIASKAGGTTKYGTLFDHSAGAAW